MVRLDHFRGFCGFWQVPACEPTAENGLWIPGPGRRLFVELAGSIPGLDLLADLPAALGGRSLLMITHDALPAGVVDVQYLLQGGRLQRP